MIEEYVTRLEKNLMVGSARWIADFTESFRDYRIDDTVLDMVVRGHMRGRGFLLSRFFAYLSLPNYQAACFVYTRELGASDLRELVKRLIQYMKDQGLDWSWLVLVKEGSFPFPLRKSVENMDIREIGIALVDISAQEIVTDRSYVGRRMRDHVRCFK